MFVVFLFVLSCKPGLAVRRPIAGASQKAYQGNPACQPLFPFRRLFVAAR